MLVTNPRKQTGTEQWEERNQFSVFILRPRRQLKDLVIAPDIADCSTMAKIIGVIFNNSLSMVRHVTAVRKSSFFIYACNIFKICNIISHDTSKTLIHAFVTARIDYC